MSSTSAIEWTDATWNPVRGCTKVSPGCANCYAETFAERFRGVKGHPYEHGFDLRLVPEKLTEPLKWKKPRRVFVNSMSDLFQDGVPDAYVGKVFDVMAQARRHTFQVLTKRPERMRALVPTFAERHTARDGSGWPLPNVWLGVSVENQHFADERIPLLLQTPAAVRFISAEPLLGRVDVRRYVGRRITHHVSVDVEGALANRSFDCLSDNGRPLTRREAEAGLRALVAQGVKRIKSTDECVGFSDQTGCPGHPQPRLDWVIVGGESGPGARPFDIAWARSIVAQCQAAGVPAFVKQLGACIAWPPAAGVRTGLINATFYRSDEARKRHRPYAYQLCDRKGGRMDEWPDDLRVREFPKNCTAPMETL